MASAAVPKLPAVVNIDGKELFRTMMNKASSPEPIMLEAIRLLKGQSLPLVLFLPGVKS